MNKQILNIFVGFLLICIFTNITIANEEILKDTSIDQEIEISEEIIENENQKVEEKESVEETTNHENINEIKKESIKNTVEEENSKAVEEIENQETIEKPIEENNESEKELEKNINQNFSNPKENNLITTNISYAENNISKNLSTNIEQAQIKNITNTSEIYLNIDSISSSSNTKKYNQNKIQSNDTTEKIEKIQDKKDEVIQITLFKDGKKEIEGIIPKKFEEEIKKQEKILNRENQFAKEVTVKSNEHLESPLLVYADIEPTPISQKNQIKIYWKNEEKEIEITDYIDENKDEFIERISWVVPHLSEQIFEITININIEINSEEIEITTISPANSSTISNPIKFEFDINYINESYLQCNITINQTIYELDISSQTTKTINLNDGNYDWELLCNDYKNLKSASAFGYFTVNEQFSLQNLEEIYLINQNIQFSTPSIYTQNKISITKPDSSIETKTFETNDIIIQNTSIIQIGTYTIEINSTGTDKPTQLLEKNFTIAKAQINLENAETITENTEKITTSLEAPNKNINSIIIDFGDGNSNTSYYTINTNQIEIDFYHKYSQAGNYIIKLITEIEEKQFIVQKEIIVQSSTDIEDPDITLINPKDDSAFKDQKINFEYTASDNIKLANCTYELYKKVDHWKELEYSRIETDIENNEKIEVQLHDFEEGYYTWYVTCHDNSSNTQTEKRDFLIYSNATQNTTKINKNHEKAEEIETLQDNIGNFLTNIDSMTLEEKKAMEELEISNELKYYQKRLVQIDQDLGLNINFISTETQKEKRKIELLEELTNIKQNIPLSFEIIKNEEYIKNTVAPNIKETIEKCVLAKNPSIEKKTLNKLIEANKNIQDKITITTQIKQIKIEYDSQTIKRTLVTKKIKTDEENKLILEAIAHDFENITFITKSNKLDNKIFEIQQKDIEEKLIYYFEGLIDPDEIKKSETILFEEKISQNLGLITGYSILEIPSIPLNYFILFLIIVFVSIILIFVIIKFKRTKDLFVEKDANLKEIENNIKKARRNIKENNIEIAKEIYNKLNRIYSELHISSQKKFYNVLKKIKIEISKKEIITLIKEYQKAKNAKRKNDSRIIYKHIQILYKSLPKTDQKIIYPIISDFI